MWYGAVVCAVSFTLRVSSFSPSPGDNQQQYSVMCMSEYPYVVWEKRKKEVLSVAQNNDSKPFRSGGRIDGHCKLTLRWCNYFLGASTMQSYHRPLRNPVSGQRCWFASQQYKGALPSLLWMLMIVIHTWLYSVARPKIVNSHFSDPIIAPPSWART